MHPEWSRDIMFLTSDEDDSRSPRDRKVGPVHHFDDVTSEPSIRQRPAAIDDALQEILHLLRVPAHPVFVR